MCNNVNNFSAEKLQIIIIIIFETISLWRLEPRKCKTMKHKSFIKKKIRNSGSSAGRIVRLTGHNLAGGSRPKSINSSWAQCSWRGDRRPVAINVPRRQLTNTARKSLSQVTILVEVGA